MEIIVCLIIVFSTFFNYSFIEACNTVEKDITQLENGSVLEGKQPLSINWITFVELLNDTIIIETYDVDKPPAISLVGERECLVRKSTVTLSKDGTRLIAYNERVKFFQNKEGKFLVDWVNGSKTKLNRMETTKERLNTVRNQSFLSSERNRIRLNCSSKRLKEVDSLYRVKKLYALAEKKKHKDFLIYYNTNILQYIPNCNDKNE